ncbi:MAG: ABC transporter ATP-binding protein [Proteobacteria bacterium]|nr:ABC transporter ATP-binding protein [Pseudomonadota bacterium]
MSQPVLDVQGLSVNFRTSHGVVNAVEDLSFQIGEGETVAIVGESGSGKSTAALALLRLIPDPPGKIVSGSVRLDGTELLTLSESEIRHIRGFKIAMIFQDPMMALNPVYTIERQIGEVLQLHLGMSRRERLLEAIELLRLVGVPAPEERVQQYPHNLSGGMRQRVMIAMALACRPRLLIADEPTTALDVTVQAQVLDLIQGLKDKFGMAVMLITHDLGIVAETADRVVVMYTGRKVEEGSVTEIFDDLRHPYTRGLLGAAKWEEGDGDMLREIPGTVPSPFDMPTGCSFQPRCPLAEARCLSDRPGLETFAPGREVRCFIAGEARS